MPWHSQHRFARISPRKARLVAELIRQRNVQDALNVLRFTHNRASQMVSKVLHSAIANADEAEADVDRLFVQEARVDEGPRMRRFRPKDRGRAHMIRKPTSHIIVVVEEEQE
ncbi:MAG: 50S ribosomal protein L22 [Phycisphaerae bacterium]